MPLISHAQWSNDSLNNLVLSDRSDDQVQPKIVTTDEGGSYVSWFDNSEGGYDVYLQRLDINGIEQWPHNGILIADRGYSSTQEYGLAIDSHGNALIAFRDDQGGTEKITANKVSESGDLLWGPTGIQVSGITGFLANPKITGTTDGQVVVAWTKDAEVIIQKLDTDGLALWGSGIVQMTKGSSLIVSDLKASDSGTAIISMVESAGFSSPKHIWAQKFAALDGSGLWGMDPIPVFDLDGGSIQFGNFPAFITDDIGGAIFTWYTTSPNLNCRVQRIDTSGVEYFVHNGIETSTNLSQIRVSPTSAFNPSTQEIYTFWKEQNLSQSMSGIYGQKLNSLGIRQWTEGGRALVSIDENQRDFIQVSILNNQPMVAWINSFDFNNEIIEGTQVDSDGEFNWSPEIVEIGSNTNTDSRLNSAVNGNHFGLYVWTESTDVKIQNLNPDGTLGIDLIFAHGFE
ncbi:MAG: hypothetical protein ACSHWU_10480 [Marinicella sp.]